MTKVNAASNGTEGCRLPSDTICSLLCGVPAQNASPESSLRSGNRQTQNERHTTKYQSCTLENVNVMEDTEKLVQAEEGTRDATIKAKGDLGLDPGPQPPAPIFIVKGHFWDN